MFDVVLFATVAVVSIVPVEAVAAAVTAVVESVDLVVSVVDLDESEAEVAEDDELDLYSEDPHAATLNTKKNIKKIRHNATTRAFDNICLYNISSL